MIFQGAARLLRRECTASRAGASVASNSTHFLPCPPPAPRADGRAREVHHGVRAAHGVAPLRGAEKGQAGVGQRALGGGHVAREHAHARAGGSEL